MLPSNCKLLFLVGASWRFPLLTTTKFDQRDEYSRLAFYQPWGLEVPCLEFFSQGNSLFYPICDHALILYKMEKKNQMEIFYQSVALKFSITTALNLNRNENTKFYSLLFKIRLENKQRQNFMMPDTGIA